MKVGQGGGRGSLPLALIDALVLATISDALTIAGVPPSWATATTCVLMIANVPAGTAYANEVVSGNALQYWSAAGEATESYAFTEGGTETLAGDWSGVDAKLD
mgnify:CR=1 FL=1